MLGLPPLRLLLIRQLAIPVNAVLPSPLSTVRTAGGRIGVPGEERRQAACLLAVPAAVRFPSSFPRRYFFSLGQKVGLVCLF